MRPRFLVLSYHEGQRGISIGYSRECIVYGIWPIAESADCLVYFSYELFRRIVRTKVRPNMAKALDGREKTCQLIFRRVFEVQIRNFGHQLVCSRIWSRLISSSSSYSTVDQATVRFRPKVVISAIVFEHILVAVLQPLALWSRDRIVTPLTDIKISSAFKAKDQ